MPSDLTCGAPDSQRPAQTRRLRYRVIAAACLVQGGLERLARHVGARQVHHGLHANLRRAGAGSALQASVRQTLRTTPAKASLPGRLPAHHVLHLGGDVEREVGGGAAGAPGDVAEHRLRAATQKGQPRVSPAAGQPCAAQARRRRVAAQPAPLRPARRVDAAPPPHAGGEHRCGSHSRPRLALARRAAPPRQRACLVLDHGVHALPQVLHAIVRFGRKKLERKERLGAGAAQRAAGRSRAPRQRRTSPLATLSLILSTICAPAERPSAVRSSAPAAGPQRGARRSRSAARRRPTHLHLRGTAARSRAAPDGGGTRSVFA